MKKQFGEVARNILGGQIANAPLPGVPLVEILGNRRILVENHYGVIAYGQERICIKVRCGHIEITGKKLTIARMSDQQMIINGIVCSVNLSFGGMQ